MENKPWDMFINPRTNQEPWLLYSICPVNFYVNYTLIANRKKKTAAAFPSVDCLLKCLNVALHVYHILIAS